MTWDLKHNGELWVYIGTPLPNPSGSTGPLLGPFAEELWSYRNDKEPCVSK